MAALRVMEATEAVDVVEGLRSVGSLGLAAAAEAARAETRVQSVLAPAPIPPPAPLATASLTSAPASPLRTVIRAHQLGQGQVGQPQRQYTGHAVSFDFQNADLRAVLRTFAEISSLNIVIDPEVDGRVDVALRDVPWDQAFDLILQTNRLEYILTGNIIRIAPSSIPQNRSDITPGPRCGTGAGGRAGRCHENLELRAGGGPGGAAHPVGAVVAWPGAVRRTDQYADHYRPGGAPGQGHRAHLGARQGRATGRNRSPHRAGQHRLRAGARDRVGDQRPGRA